MPELSVPPEQVRTLGRAMGQAHDDVRELAAGLTESGAADLEAAFGRRAAQEGVTAAAAGFLAAAADQARHRGEAFDALAQVCAASAVAFVRADQAEAGELDELADRLTRLHEAASAVSSPAAPR